MEEVIEYIEGGDNITLQEDFSYAGMGWVYRHSLVNWYIEYIEAI
jgi:hypothetical protein